MSLVLAIVDAWRPLSSRLQEVADFGTNPGGLRMLTYAPDDLPSKPALVVALHGSTQSAAQYDLGAGWSTLADQHVHPASEWRWQKPRPAGNAG